MSNGVLHPSEVCSITDKLEISPSKNSSGDLLNAAKDSKKAPSGRSSARGGVESGFKGAPNSTKGPRR
jgi:hypothetical protein